MGFVFVRAECLACATLGTAVIVCLLVPHMLGGCTGQRNVGCFSSPSVPKASVDVCKMDRLGAAFLVTWLIPLLALGSADGAVVKGVFESCSG
jgi:hypothetical protein